MKDKEILRIVFVGEVDHGKSTLIGRLLLDSNSLPFGKIEDVKKIAKELGQDTVLAFLADQLKEERENNLTIDTTQISLKSGKRNYILIDTPGHVEFIKNMMTGASFADIAILVIGANEGTTEQTKRHMNLLGFFDIKTVIVIINKMDLVHFSQERFEETTRALQKLAKVFDITTPYIIPVSAKEGDYVFKKSKRMKWHKGPTLLTLLNKISIKAKPTKSPLRLPVQDIYNINGEKIMVGKIVSGKIKIGEDVVILPSHQKAKINSIRVFGQQKKEAECEENIGFSLTPKINLKRGDVICHPTDLPQVTTSLKSRLFWPAKKPLQIKDRLALRLSTQEIICTVEEIKERIDSASLEVIEQNATSLYCNEMGTIRLDLDQPLVFENFDLLPEMGSLILEDSHLPVGIGITTRGRKK